VVTAQATTRPYAGYQAVITMQIELGGRVAWKRQLSDFFCVSVTISFVLSHNVTISFTQYVLLVSSAIS
jgi:hypothetical protein